MLSWNCLPGVHSDVAGTMIHLWKAENELGWSLEVSRHGVNCGGWPLPLAEVEQPLLVPHLPRQLTR